MEFQTLHAGLGFHPFEEGLPYSSPNSAPKRPVVPREIKPLRHTPPVPAQTPASTSSVFAIQKPQERLTERDPRFEFGYSLRRMGAYLVDLVFHLSLFSLFFGLTAAQLGVSPSVFFERDALSLTFGVFFILHAAFLAAEEVTLGSSLGKRIFGLRMEGNAIRVFARSFLFPFSVLALGIGLFSSLWDPRGRAWHDRLSGVAPIPR